MIRRHVEALLIRLAAWILVGRNVPRHRVVSRRDNNDMYYMGESLESVAKRIASGYTKGLEGYQPLRKPGGAQ